MNSIRTLTAAAVLGLGSAVGATQAATIYSENFVTASATSVSAFGWTGYTQAGTNYSTSTTDPLYASASNYFFISSGTTKADSRGIDIVMLSDAGSIDPTNYLNDLTISFNEHVVDNSTTPQNQWRVVLQVGSTIYASNVIQPVLNGSGTSSNTTHNLVVSSSIWHVWTGEINLTNGFATGSISGTAGNLAAGAISNIGILYEETGYNSENDRGYLNSVTITGTEAPLPEPASLVLMGLGGLLLLSRRKRV
ncbi:MAG: PEP-CTERM sorting domain-containing protein [Phycisphaera sp.]|nr:PEP-CTERM sorting domain-containing protein [Phycisphaera sp.]